jgi:hypothetical protein
LSEPSTCPLEWHPPPWKQGADRPGRCGSDTVDSAARRKRCDGQMLAGFLAGAHPGRAEDSHHEGRAEETRAGQPELPECRHGCRPVCAFFSVQHFALLPHTPLEAQLRHDPPVRLVLVKNGTAVRAKAGNARFCGRRAPTPPSPVAPPPTASASRNRSVVHKSHPASASASASHLAQPLGSVKVAIITDEAGDEARKVKPY